MEKKRLHNRGVGLMILSLVMQNCKGMLYYNIIIKHYGKFRI